MHKYFNWVNHQKMFLSIEHPQNFLAVEITAGGFNKKIMLQCVALCICLTGQIKAGNFGVFFLCLIEKNKIISILIQFCFMGRGLKSCAHLLGRKSELNQRNLLLCKQKFQTILVFSLWHINFTHFFVFVYFKSFIYSLLHENINVWSHQFHWGVGIQP